jgi:YbgC/YbaW family acyl-CoA thioester hydrolase
VTQSRRTFNVNMTDVDLVQVNFARFFVWMDDGYDALLRELGHPLSGILASGFGTPVVDARCEYRRPVTLDDEFTLRSAVVSHGRSSYVVGHRFEDERGVFAVGRCVHVWLKLGEGGSATPVPAWLTNGLEPAFLDEVKPPA